MRNLEFVIPKYIYQDWESKAKEATGTEQLLFANFSRAKSLIDEIEDFSVTPERLGWMLVWINTFRMIKSTFLAWKVNSEYLIRILSRIELESSLIANTIIEPAIYLFERYKDEGNITPIKSTQNRKLDQCIDRLSAYLAFCITKDEEILKEALESRNLEGTWDPEPGREVRSDEDKLEFHEKWWGELDLETDEKVVEERKKDSKSNIHQRLDYLQQFQNNDKLKKWFSKIEELQKKTKGHLQFFELFDSSKTSVWQKMKQYDIAHGYLQYKMGSLLIHSSTFEQQFFYHKNNISPQTHAFKDVKNAKAKSIFQGCTSSLLILRLLQGRIWDEVDDI